MHPRAARRSRVTWVAAFLALAGAAAAPLAFASPAPSRLAAVDRYRPAAPRPADPLSAAAVARLRSEGASVLWVYFTDKGERDPLSFENAVRAAGAQVGARAKARRARETGGTFVPDWYDVPVVASYVEGVASSGARVRNVLKWFNAVTIEADEATARRVAALPFVLSVEPASRAKSTKPVDVGPVIDAGGLAPRGSSDGAGRMPRLPDTGNNGTNSDTWAGVSLAKPTNYGLSLAQLTSINVPAVHDSGYSGAGEILCVIDTGFDETHTANSPLHKIAEWDFIQHDGETANQAGDVASQWEHGTGTWSVAGGYWPTVLIGPAYNAAFLLAKTEYVPTETHVEEDNWVAAAQWADSIGADVITSSLGYSDFDPAGTGGGDYAKQDMDGRTSIVTQGAVFAHRRGILVCNSMGNEGSLGATSITCPADADSIVSVGAVDVNNVLAGFSSRGPTWDGRTKPEVVAQGVGVYWAVAGSPNSYSTASGTSLSCPLVAGVGTLVREAHPEWTNYQVRTALMTTADRAGAPDNNYGWGRVNARAAIYTSSLGGPIYPYPFTLVSPPHQSTLGSVPITLRWNRARDPQPGDAVGYEVSICTISPAQCVFTTTTADTQLVVTASLLPFTQYEWYVTAKDPANHARESRDRYRFTTGNITGVAMDAPPTAPKVLLAQARPNPVSTTARIDYSFAGAPGVVPVDLRIFDAQGRLVRTLLANHPEVVPMNCSVTWDGHDQSGRMVPSGIYYYQLEAMGQRYSKRLVIVR
ncbi:MAG TPA: S8 family serine peptidase [Candidatus Eisenbacteria bacterium]|nr:S8 family serine peptidase [Candidatus Eisenbacteria bacterium]